MKLAILHLSDIHLRDGVDNPVLQWGESIAAAVQPETLECSAILVAITGDIAFSGKEAEYDHFRVLLATLKEALIARKLMVLGMVAVPGNHDCDFSLTNQARDALLQNAVLEPDASVVRACTSIQKAFGAAMTDVAVDHPGPDRLLEQATFLVDGAQVSCFCFNSAWMSSRKESPGSLRFPEPLVAGLSTPPASPEHLCIWMMHHPYGWFHPDDAKKLIKYIENTTDIVLTGHEHETGSYTRTNFGNARLQHVEGGVLQEGPLGTSSSFNLLIVDGATARQRIVRFFRENGVFVSSGTETWTALVRNHQKATQGPTPSAAWSDELEDPGATFSHPRRPSLRLSDVFVFPDARVVPLGTNGAKKEVVRDLVDLVLHRRRVIFMAPEKAGKSSLAKALTMQLSNRGLFVLLMRGQEFAPKDAKRLREQLRARIQTCYSLDWVERSLQLKSEARAIVVDDFHLVRLSREGRANLLRMLMALFDTVVLMTSTDMQMECVALARLETSENPLLSFTLADVMQLGHVKRHELVVKWQWLGRDRSIHDQGTVQKDILNTEDVVSQVIGNGMVPSYPICILLLLQSMEAGRLGDTGAGSLGYLYHSLILDSVSKVARSESDKASRVNYLTELAWHLVTLRDGGTGSADYARGLSMTESQCLEWHAGYCQRMKLHLPYPAYVDDLSRVGLLRQSPVGVGFAYPYIRYYFTASYLMSHMHEADTRARVAKMSEQLHDEETATTMVFLAHLSKDPFVIDTMLRAARSLYLGQDEWDAASHNAYLNSLVRETPKLAQLRLAIEKNRIEQLEGRDEHELERGDVDAVSNRQIEPLDKSADNIAPLMQINSAFKTMQIIGQILTSYHGAILGDRKVDLSEACIRLALRFLGFAFQSLSKDGDNLIKDIVAHVIRMRPEAAITRVVSDANAFLFALVERLAFTTVRHLSQSMGHRELHPIYEEVFQRLGWSTPVSLVDLAIKLDHWESLPAQEAVALWAAERENTVVATVIRHLVWQHLYLYPTDFKTRQFLCGRLGIDDQPNLIAGGQKLIN